ncbi:putative endonuclease, GIY-YIG superfamily [Desulfuromonas soudanensis]|uniref:Putative endonuclease, GIY-YIG superfamily n=1 Tax=Desulfuromonas soudanensis TaxID=1603606 RepID=A0A0M5IVR8_9BACT|nr:GIY-YIG nuclease family protein [Desulfuromonas soudanensis]ALC16286.1 putative endonuclease, GIY-YIG superfamily [Desulfuromonas soudanensis]
MGTWSLYILRNERNALYTGISNDLPRRLAEHRAGGCRGARFTRGCTTLDLVYTCKLGDRSLALKVELRVKKLHKRRKEALVAATPNRQQLLDLLDLGVTGALLSESNF